MFAGQAIHTWCPCKELLYPTSASSYRQSYCYMPWPDMWWQKAVSMLCWKWELRRLWWAVLESHWRGAICSLLVSLEESGQLQTVRIGVMICNGKKLTISSWMFDLYSTTTWERANINKSKRIEKVKSTWVNFNPIRTSSILIKSSIESLYKKW